VYYLNSLLGRKMLSLQSKELEGFLVSLFTDSRVLRFVLLDFLVLLSELVFHPLTTSPWYSAHLSITSQIL
jgi:hypothetical protein